MPWRGMVPDGSQVLSAKARFVKMVIEGKIVIRRRPEAKEAKEAK